MPRVSIASFYVLSLFRARRWNTFIKAHRGDVTIPFVVRFLRTMFDFLYDMEQRGSRTVTYTPEMSW